MHKPMHIALATKSELAVLLRSEHEWDMRAEEYCDLISLEQYRRSDSEESQYGPLLPLGASLVGLGAGSALACLGGQVNLMMKLMPTYLCCSRGNTVLGGDEAESSKSRQD